VVDDLLFDFLAVFAGASCRASAVGEELRAVVVELFALPFAISPVDVAVGDVALVVAVLLLAKFFDDEHAVDQVLDDAVLRLLDFWFSSASLCDSR